MLLSAGIIYLTASMPFPIRECDTDSDCVAAAASIGCREYHNVKRPHILFVCDKEKYLQAVKGKDNE